MKAIPILTIALCFVFSGASNAQSHTHELMISTSMDKTAIKKVPEFIGLSGMVKVGHSAYLGVHDTKGFQEGLRVSIISVAKKKKVLVQEIQFSEWEDEEKRSSDLECICEIPGKEDEFFLVESGSWKDDEGDIRSGKMYRVRIDLIRRTGTILATKEMPIIHPSMDDPTDDDKVIWGDQIEGVICIDRGESKVQLVYAERGGSDKYPQGRIRWSTYDLTSNALTTTDAGRVGDEINDLGTWQDAKKNRDISDLILDGNVVWAVGSEDPGDAGPFASTIYKLGTLSETIDKPITLETDPKTNRMEIAGIKVEALAKPTMVTSGSKFAIGFDDEIFGSGWRGIRWKKSN